jgi:hypothetical protein
MVVRCTPDNVPSKADKRQKRGWSTVLLPEGFDALTSKASLVDLWRRTNGTDAHEWTWLSNQNRFRIDQPEQSHPG